MARREKKNAYLAYVLVETEQRDHVSLDAFYVKANSLKDAKRIIETEWATIAHRDAPNLVSRFFVRRGDVGDVVSNENVAALVGLPEPSKDVLVASVLPDGKGGASIVTPQEPSRRTAAKEKTFVAFVTLDDEHMQYLPIVATIYTEAREKVLRLAAWLHVENPNSTATFGIRNQVVPKGKTVADMVNVPWKRSEELVRLERGEGGKTAMTFPGQLSPKFKPHQHKADRSAFVDEQLDQAVELMTRLMQEADE